MANEDGLNDDYFGVPKDFKMKYRPRKLSEFCNFKTSRPLRLLQRQLELNSLPQLAILAGPHGCGKTSAAYVLGAWSSCLRWKEQQPP